MLTQFLVISYDTPSDRKRRKFLRLLRDFGTHVQYSVFECRLKPDQIEQLQSLPVAKLSEAIAPAQKTLPRPRYPLLDRYNFGPVIDGKILVQLVLVRLDHNGQDVAVPVEDLTPVDSGSVPPPADTI